MIKEDLNQRAVQTVKHEVGDDFPKDFDYFSLLKVIYDSFKLKKTSSNVKQAICDLRRLLKYQKGFFLPFFDNLLDYFAMILSSENYQITQDALIFLQELFYAPCRDAKCNEWVAILLPKLIRLSLIEDDDEEIRLIKSLTDSCIENCSVLWIDKGVIDVLIDQLDNADRQIALKCFHLIKDLLMRTELEIFKESVDWDDLFSKAKEISNRLGVDLIESMRNCFSKSQWEDIISTIDTSITDEIMLKLTSNRAK